MANAIDGSSYSRRALSTLSITVEFQISNLLGVSNVVTAITSSTFQGAFQSALVNRGFTGAVVNSVSTRSFSSYTGWVAGITGASASRVGAGVGASIAIALALALLPLLVCCAPHSGGVPHMEAWKPRAARAFKPLYGGYALLTLGLLTGLAAPAIPWYAMTYSRHPLSQTQVFSALTTDYTVSMGDIGYSISGFTIVIIGGVVVYGGLALVLAAWAMALLAVIRVRGVARSGVAPPVSGGCAPSMPAILGCAWVGFAVVLAGSGAAWALSAVQLAFLPPISGLGPGAALLAFAVAAIAGGAVLLSVASAMLGNLPGVGAARANCCCMETQAMEQPVGAPAAPAAPAAAYVLHDFAAIDEGTLSVQKHERVVIVGEEDADGWIEVLVEGTERRGLLPATYLGPDTTAAGAVARQPTSVGGDATTSNAASAAGETGAQRNPLHGAGKAAALEVRNPLHSPAALQAPALALRGSPAKKGPPPPAPPLSSCGVASVLHHFDAAGDADALTVRKGERVVVLGGDGEWVDVRVEGAAPERRGVVPASYVRLAWATTLHDFAATDEDTLSVHRGQRVVVVAGEDAEGWVEVHAEGEPGRRGLVPAAYIRHESNKLSHNHKRSR